MRVAVVVVRVLVVVLVVVVLEVAGVDVWCPPSCVVFVGCLVDMCEYGVFEAAREGHPHAVGVVGDFAMVEVLLRFIEVVV